MGGEKGISKFEEISKKIDYFCEKIRLTNEHDNLKDFNEVMKKLLFG